VPFGSGPIVASVFASTAELPRVSTPNSDPAFVTLSTAVAPGTPAPVRRRARSLSRIVEVVPTKFPRMNVPPRPIWRIVAPPESVYSAVSGSAG